MGRRKRRAVYKKYEDNFYTRTMRLALAIRKDRERLATIAKLMPVRRQPVNGVVEIRVQK